MVDVTALPAGPWDKKLPEFISTKKVAIVICKIDCDAVEHEFIIDYGNYEHRKFLGRLTYWAVTSGRTVETLDADEWNKIK